MMMRAGSVCLWMLSAVVVGLSWGSPVARAAAGVALPAAESATDAPYSVSVNGHPIPVEPGTRLERTYVARFRSTGSSPATVRVSAKGGGSLSLRPDRAGAEATVEAGALTFRVADTTPRIVRAEGHGYLFLFPEPPGPRPDESAAGVVAIAPADGAVAEHTQRIQEAIDRVSAAGGGTVYLRPGVHRCRSIRLRSHVTLHVAAGAMLQGTGRPEDYQAARGGRCLVLVDRAEGAAICGLGILDGAGHVLQKRHGVKARLIVALSCRRLTIRDVVLRDPGAWTVHLIGCHDVSVARVKVLGDWGLANTDGINPDMSDDVVIEDCFIYSGDDAIAVKTTGSFGIGRASHHITARDCIIMTRKTSCKIGTESRYDIHDVLFEDIEIVDSSRGCALWMRDGATYSNITYRDIRMNLMRLPGEQWSGEAYRIIMQERHGQGKVNGILFDRIQAASPQRSILSSKIGHPVCGVTFKGCIWHADATGCTAHVEVDHAKDITFVGCFVERDGRRRPFTKRLIQGPSRDAVRVKGR